jgi:hypothetical protein
MFLWYKNSKVCYVYLSDVETFKCDKKWKKEEIVARLQGSKWFTRGWTLQELIAPVTLIFFSKDWVQLGVIQNALYDDSSPHTFDPSEIVPRFKAAVCAIANVPGRALGVQDFSHFTVAERMSWAVDRKTTLVEDAAYSLLGLFDINMPVLYGEGHKAFQRLQVQIIQTTEDYTIFAWEPRWREKDVPESGSVLAVMPANFTPKRGGDWTYEDLRRFPAYQQDWDKSELDTRGGHIPPSVTSRGIWMPLPIVERKRDSIGLLSKIPKMGPTFWLGMEVKFWSRPEGYPEWFNQMLSREVRESRRLIVIDVKDVPVQVKLIYASTLNEYI